MRGNQGGASHSIVENNSRYERKPGMRGNKTREFPLILKAITRGVTIILKEREYHTKGKIRKDTLILKARRVERGLLNCNSRVKPIQG